MRGRSSVYPSGSCVVSEHAILACNGSTYHKAVDVEQEAAKTAQKLDVVCILHLHQPSNKKVTQLIWQHREAAANHAIRAVLSTTKPSNAANAAMVGPDGRICVHVGRLGLVHVVGRRDGVEWGLTGSMGLDGSVLDTLATDRTKGSPSDSIEPMRLEVGHNGPQWGLVGEDPGTQKRGKNLPVEVVEVVGGTKIGLKWGGLTLYGGTQAAARH